MLKALKVILITLRPLPHHPITPLLHYSITSFTLSFFTSPLLSFSIFSFQFSIFFVRSGHAVGLSAVSLLAMCLSRHRVPSHNLRFRSRIQDSAGSQRMPLQSLTRGLLLSRKTLPVKTSLLLINKV